jgi:hypothetical protein
MPPYLPTKQIPNTKEEFSFFVNLDATDATQEEVANAMPEGIVGVVPRLDLKVIEFVCADRNVMKKAATTGFQVEGRKKFYGILPRHQVNRVLLVKLANVPFGKEEDLKKAIQTYWSKHGEVLDVAPHKYPGKPWLTKRWDLLLRLKEGETKLKVEPVFKLEGFEDTILATWRIASFY